jgi:hypothetical protein
VARGAKEERVHRRINGALHDEPTSHISGERQVNAVQCYNTLRPRH